MHVVKLDVDRERQSGLEHRVGVTGMPWVLQSNIDPKLAARAVERGRPADRETVPARLCDRDAVRVGRRTGARTRDPYRSRPRAPLDARRAARALSSASHVRNCPLRGSVDRTAVFVRTVVFALDVRRRKRQQGRLHRGRARRLHAHKKGPSSHQRRLHAHTLWASV